MGVVSQKVVGLHSSGCDVASIEEEEAPLVLALVVGGMGIEEPTFEDTVPRRLRGELP